MSVLIISMLFVGSCKSNEYLYPTNSIISEIENPTKSNIPEELSPVISSSSIESETSNVDSDIKINVDLAGFTGRYANRNPYNVYIDLLKETYNFPSPGYVDVYLNNGDLNIGFIYEIGINRNFFPTLLDEISQENWPHSESGENYLYYGELEYLDKNIYASNGKWPKDLNLMEDICGENTDFYVVFKYDGVYVYFENVDLETIYDSISKEDPHFVRYQGETENYDGPKEGSAN